MQDENNNPTGGEPNQNPTPSDPSSQPGQPPVGGGFGQGVPNPTPGGTPSEPSTPEQPTAPGAPEMPQAPEVPQQDPNNPGGNPTQ